MAEETWYVPNTVVLWPDKYKGMDTVGFIPVYRSVEELKKHHPDAQYRKEVISGKPSETKDMGKVVPLKEIK